MKNLFGFGAAAGDGLEVMDVMRRRPRAGGGQPVMSAEARANQIMFLALLEDISPADYERRLRLKATARLMHTTGDGRAWALNPRKA